MSVARRRVGGAFAVTIQTTRWHVCRKPWRVLPAFYQAVYCVPMQIGSRNYAPSAADFFAVSMQEIGAFSVKSETADFGRKGRNFGGQD